MTRPVLVTGSTGAIGGAICRKLHSCGYLPVLHYSSNREAAFELAREFGEPEAVIHADLLSENGASTLWAEVVKRFGPPVGLVNNAGIRVDVAFDADSSAWTAAWRRDLQLNLIAPAELCRLAVLTFRDRGGGRIVNIASRAGQRGFSENALSYGASKAGLINLTKSIARSFGGQNIVCTAIAPGFVDTPLASDFLSKNPNSTALAEIPVGVMVKPDEIAELVAYCMSESNVSINGSTIDINGGSYMR